MKEVERNEKPTVREIETFLSLLNFVLPKGFLDFYEKSNGAIITTEDQYIVLWTLTEMVQLNDEYDVEEYASEFFVFGSDGGDTAFAIKKKTGDIYEMPFIGMANEEAVFRNKTFDEFIKEM